MQVMYDLVFRDVRFGALWHGFRSYWFALGRGGLEYGEPTSSFLQDRDSA